MESLRIRARLAGCVKTVIFVLAGAFAMGKADCLGLVLESVCLLQRGGTVSLTLDNGVCVSLYLFYQCPSFLRLFLRLDFFLLFFPCYLMLSLILAASLREAIPK